MYASPRTLRTQKKRETLAQTVRFHSNSTMTERNHAYFKLLYISFISCCLQKTDIQYNRFNSPFWEPINISLLLLSKMTPRTEWCWIYGFGVSQFFCISVGLTWHHSLYHAWMGTDLDHMTWKMKLGCFLHRQQEYEMIEDQMHYFYLIVIVMFLDCDVHRSRAFTHTVSITIGATCLPCVPQGWVSDLLCELISNNSSTWTRKREEDFCLTASPELWKRWQKDACEVTTTSQVKTFLSQGLWKDLLLK